MSRSNIIEILACLYLLERSEERWVTLFFFSKLFNFCVSFRIYHVFCIPEYSTRMYPLCADVGLVHPTDFARTR
jgi:hypothetical protein